ncbi:ferredoxin [Nocardioides perillae]|nr:ferredoxin [Nocardioides perillae]
MRIVPDYDTCEGIGMCQSMAPDFFELDDDDNLQILDEHPAEEHRTTVAAAVASCPVQALRLEG